MAARAAACGRATTFHAEGRFRHTGHDGHMRRPSRKIEVLIFQLNVTGYELGQRSQIKRPPFGGPVDSDQGRRPGYRSLQSAARLQIRSLPRASTAFISHCPKCQGLARAQWLADRQADLLPVAASRPNRIDPGMARQEAVPVPPAQWTCPGLMDG
jgi:hypothetical protein